MAVAVLRIGYAFENETWHGNDTSLSEQRNDRPPVLQSYGGEAKVW